MSVVVEVREVDVHGVRVEVIVFVEQCWAAADVTADTSAFAASVFSNFAHLADVPIGGDDLGPMSTDSALDIDQQEDIFDTLRRTCPEALSLQKSCKLAFAPVMTSTPSGLPALPTATTMRSRTCPYTPITHEFKTS